MRKILFLEISILQRGFITYYVMTPNKLVHGAFYIQKPVAGKIICKPKDTIIISTNFVFKIHNVFSGLISYSTTRAKGTLMAVNLFWGNFTHRCDFQEEQNECIIKTLCDCDMWIIC